MFKYVMLKCDYQTTPGCYQVGFSSNPRVFESSGLQKHSATHFTPLHPRRSSRQATSNFRFNGRVLGPKSTQEDVFSEACGSTVVAVPWYVVFGPPGTGLRGLEWNLGA